MNHRKRLFATIQIVLLMLLASTMAAGAQQKSPAPGTPSMTGQVGKGVSQQTGGGASPVMDMGSGFTYQGKLTNGGAAATGQYDLNFSLWDAPSGGTQVGSLIAMNSLQVNDGLFTVNLDFGSTAFQGQIRWLEIQ